MTMIEETVYHHNVNIIMNDKTNYHYDVIYLYDVNIIMND